MSPAAQAQEQSSQTSATDHPNRSIASWFGSYYMRRMQCACWNRSLSAELSGLILGKTSGYNVRMVAVSCPLLHARHNQRVRNGADQV